ncbi:MAG: tetratricopeptide repeat protein [Candidatus Helarchaeota archaeon]|nr:tetratricopeptide repeat protein [Candidatus Helarchaeota archaeon]
MADSVNYLELGRKAMQSNNMEEAINFFNKALPTADMLQQVEIYKSLGEIYGKSAQAKQAIIEYTKGLKVAAEIQDINTQVKMLQAMGVLCQETKNYPEAIKCNEKCLEKIKEIKSDIATEAEVTRSLGTLYSLTKNHFKALSTLQRALQLQRDLGSKKGEGLALYELALEQADSENVKDARANLLAAQKIFTKLGMEIDMKKVVRELKAIESELEEAEWIDKKTLKQKKKIQKFLE